MSSTPWMLLCNPWSPNTVSPGRFVLDRDNPQDNCDLKEDVPKAPNITVTDIDELSVLHSPSTDNKFSLHLSTFASQFFGKSHTQTTELKTSKARRYTLENASAWLDEIATVPIVQAFMEKRIILKGRGRKKLWLITGTITLENAEAPSEQVFQVQYARVKLRSVKDQNTAYLATKPRWQQTWVPEFYRVDEHQREFGESGAMVEAFVEETEYEDEDDEMVEGSLLQSVSAARKTVAEVDPGAWDWVHG